MRKPVDCTYGMRYFMALEDMKDIWSPLTGYALQWTSGYDKVRQMKYIQLDFTMMTKPEMEED